MLVILINYFPAVGCRVMMKEIAIKYGKLKLDVDSRKFFIGRRVIPLRNKEYSLLEYFMMNVGKVLSRTQILEDVWDRNIFCPTNTIDVHVSGLRQKLQAYTKRNPIKTIYCIGYMFDLRR
ncbi:winged helix-turn-helix transcriptional regulator [Candidatus Peregrinibacteria bacterium]|nr:winged helix-turn-helix transcriptional regulator [Candidatus Peregrinibacteria bacterium]